MYITLEELIDNPVRSHNAIGSMGLVYLPRFRFFFMVNVGKKNIYESYGNDRITEERDRFHHKFVGYFHLKLWRSHPHQKRGRKPLTFSGLWFQICFIVTPIWGRFPF